MKKNLLTRIIAASLVGIILILSVLGGTVSEYEKKLSMLFKAKNTQNEQIAALMNGLPPWVTEEIILTCLELQEEYGIYASVTIAQAHQEVGGTWNGSSLYNTAAIDYNLFGLKATNGISVWNGETTWDGKRGSTGTYRKYQSYTQGLKDRARLLLTSDTYATIATTANNRSGSQAQLEALSKSPWCENQYSTLSDIMEQYQLARLDSLTVASYYSLYGTGGSFTGTFIYYNQADPKWGSLPYVAGKTIQSSGCAACCLAMVWATYSGDTSINPETIFRIGNSNGALVGGLLSRDGCTATTNLYRNYGCSAVHSLNWERAYKALDQGGAVMCVGSGNLPFSSRGHWILIIGYSGNTAYLADPGHRACTWSQIGGRSEGESLSYIKSATQDMIIFTPR